MDWHRVSEARFFHTVAWAILLSALIIAIAATLGRAALTLNAALSDKPDIAIYLLLPKEEISETVLLRDRGFEREYLAETKEGPKLVRLRKAGEEWIVAEVEKLRE